MNYVIKREDRDQRNIHVSESCYFRDGDKRNLPTITNRNTDKQYDLLPCAESKLPPKMKVQIKSDP